MPVEEPGGPPWKALCVTVLIGWRLKGSLFLCGDSAGTCSAHPWLPGTPSPAPPGPALQAPLKRQAPGCLALGQTCQAGFCFSFPDPQVHFQVMLMMSEKFLFYPNSIPLPGGSRPQKLLWDLQGQLA